MVNHLPQGRGDARLHRCRQTGIIDTLIDKRMGKGKINPNKNRTVRALAGAGGRQHHTAPGQRQQPVKNRLAAPFFCWAVNPLWCALPGIAQAS